MASSLADKVLVIKVGGSLVETGRVQTVLPLIAAARRRVIVVPGGGEFANKVRDLQNALRFDDAAAHKMAILGMHQMAEIFFKLEPRLAPADSLEGFQRIAATGHVPVWLPWQMCANDKEIPADWSITSDGLAARLAERLGGAEVLLLKSAAVPASSTAADIASEGIVDPVFPVIVARAKLDWRVLGPDDDQQLKEALRLPVDGPAAAC